MVSEYARLAAHLGPPLLENELMRTTDLYVLRQVVKNAGVIFIFILVAILLERTLRILGELGPSQELPGYLFNLLLNRIPEVIGIALPACLFGGALLAFLRLNRDRELIAFHATGIGLHRLVMPVFALAIVVSLLTLAVLGFLRPYGIYQYRAIVHQATQTSFVEIFKIGTFVHLDGRTFYIKDWSRGADDLGEVFIFDRDQDGNMNVTAAETGYLTNSDDNSELLLIARDGQRMTIRKEGGLSSLLSFEDARWRLYSIEETPFRPRGSPESEKTLPELWSARNEELPRAQRNRIRAEFHQRLAHILSILLMPFVAVPLALARSLIGQGLGIGAGVVAIVAIDQGILMGEALAARDVLSPWIGIWGAVASIAVVGSVAFPLAAFKLPGDLKRRLFGILPHSGGTPSEQDLQRSGTT